MGNPANWLVNRKQTCLTGPLEYKYQVIFLLVLGATCTQRRAVDNKILGIIEWGWVGYKEFCRSRRLLSTEALRDLQNSSYLPKVEFNNCFIINSKYFLLLKGVSPLRSLHDCFSAHLVPRFLGERFNNLRRAALLTSFWSHRFNNFRQAALLTSLIQYGEDPFQIW